jgi:sec-independent protein translocase protein TatC
VPALVDVARYAIVAVSALGLLLPGADPVTTALELVPMLLLYELSIAVAALLERRLGTGA